MWGWNTVLVLVKKKNVTDQEGSVRMLVLGPFFLTIILNFFRTMYSFDFSALLKKVSAFNMLL